MRAGPYLGVASPGNKDSLQHLLLHSLSPPRPGGQRGSDEDVKQLHRINASRDWEHR